MATFINVSMHMVITMEMIAIITVITLWLHAYGHIGACIMVVIVVQICMHV